MILWIVIKIDHKWVLFFESSESQINFELASIQNRSSNFRSFIVGEHMFDDKLCCLFSHNISNL